MATATKTFKGQLPQGYFEMSESELQALEIESLRSVYKKHHETAAYFMGRSEATEQAKARKPETPAQWIIALRKSVCECERCSGRGVYYWGACVNGKMSHSAPCARCNGKGRLNFDDMRRSKYYDNHRRVI